MAVKDIIAEIKNLSEQDRRQLFAALAGEFSEAVWDLQIESDSRNGALKAIADDAVAEHRAGSTRPL
jgi:hypothetical protein